MTSEPRRKRPGFGVVRRLVTLLGGGLCAASTLTGTAGAEVVSWHGPWHGQDLYVQLVTRGHEPDRSTPNWWQWGNLRSDVYLFGFGSAGVDLVVEFSEKNGRPVAAVVTVPRAQREQVTTSFNGYSLPVSRVPRRRLPDASLSPLKGDWTTGGLPNFDLSGTLNTPAPFVLRVGSTVPGRPTWTTTLATGTADPRASVPQFGAAVQEDLSVPYELARPLIPGFPYLSAGPEDQFYGPNKPLYYVTDKRELQTRFVGFQTAGLYAVNSYARPPKLAFEAPFAWYRFDPAAGRFPNMMVRVEQFPAGYRNAPVPDAQRTAPRISWTGQDERKWRYSVSVVGDHPLNDSVKIGNVPTRSVAYARLAPWIAERSWQGASFVEATAGFSGSEGIYSYSVEANPELFSWINGASEAPPDTFEFPYLGGLSVVSPHLLPQGFRGEYSLVYNRKPALYLSGIDRRVHLDHAQAGLWNLGPGLLQRTADLTGDGRVDHWRVERLPAAAKKATPADATMSKTTQPLTATEPTPIKAVPGTTEQALYALNGHLLVSDAAGIAVTRSAAAPDRPLPLATDAARWREFLASVPQESGQTAATETVPDPARLRSWLNGLAQVQTLPGAALSGVRVSPDGFRMVIRAPGTAIAAAARPDLTLRAALALARTGSHVLQFSASSGRWTVLPAETPVLRGQLRAAALRDYTPTTVTITLHNTGTLDQSGPAVLTVNGEEVQRWPELLVPAHGSVTRQVNWTPYGADTHAFTVSWPKVLSGTLPDEKLPNEGLAGRTLSGRTLSGGPSTEIGTLKVGALDRVTGLSALDLSAPFGNHGLLDLVLISVCALAGLWLVWRKSI